jgi:hypothetical protein
MRKAERVAAVALAAGCAASLTACGTKGIVDAATVRTVKPKISDPLASMTGVVIARRAVSDTERATTVTFAGVVNSIQMNLTFASGSNCEGTVGYGGSKGSLQLLKKGSEVWIRPDDAFWTAQGATQTELDLVGGKYISLTPADKSYSDFASVCGVLRQTGGDPARVRKDGITWIDGGQQVVVLTDLSDKSRLYATDTTDPVILRVTAGTSGSGSVSITTASTPTVISAPPSDITLEGSRLGL